jgi:hypothetical protein
LRRDPSCGKLRAERDGRIARLHASTGASLAVDQAILEFE